MLASDLLISLISARSAIASTSAIGIPNFSDIDSLPIKKVQDDKKLNTSFIKEKIKINKVDYYYTNSISRSSKTMAECRKIRDKELKYGTNN